MVPVLLVFHVKDNFTADQNAGLELGPLPFDMAQFPTQGKAPCSGIQKHRSKTSGQAGHVFRRLFWYLTPP